MKLSDKIKKTRLSRNITQVELSKKSGVRQAAISDFENGKNISIQNLEKIMKVLDMEIVGK